MICNDTRVAVRDPTGKKAGMDGWTDGRRVAGLWFSGSFFSDSSACWSPDVCMCVCMCVRVCICVCVLLRMSIDRDAGQVVPDDLVNCGDKSRGETE